MGEAILETRSLCKNYHSGSSLLHVLKGADLALKPGDFLVLLGPSGSGKSTLLHLMGLMDKPSSGEVWIHGRKASSLGEDARAALRNSAVGFVFQFDSLLAEFTILENVSMPWRMAGRASAEGRRTALELLARMGLERLRDRFPSQLSGGERQRAALCRALVNSPSIVLADEPTGNLDKPGAELVFKDLRELASSRRAAVVMVTHNEAAAGYATRVARLKDGEIKESA